MGALDMRIPEEDLQDIVARWRQANKRIVELWYKVEGAEIDQNQWGRPIILYQGVNQTTKQWTTLETYGGKLVENLVQAIARDCLAIAIENLEKAGYPIVFHVHDEVVIECRRDDANLAKVVEIMTTPISWAEGLPINADGWVGDFFRKD